MEMSVNAVEDVYKALGSGNGMMTSRQNLWVSPPKSIKLASAVLSRWGFMGITALLYDSRNGTLLADVQSRFISWYRTGASSAVTTKFLARKDSESISIIGTGRQARTQILSLHAVLPSVRQINVFSPTREHREKFASEMTAELGAKVTASETAEMCVQNADVVVTVTTSKEPVLKHRWLKKGVHICAIGAHYPEAREVDSDTVASSKVVVDSRDQALLEKGELLIPIDEKRVSQDVIYAELGEIVASKKPGRTSEDENTLFCSGGLSIEQIGVAARVYEAVVNKGLGVQI